MGEHAVKFTDTWLSRHTQSYAYPNAGKACVVLGLRLPATHAYIYMTQGQQLILSQRAGDDLERVCVCVGTSAPPKGAGLHPLCGVRWWPPSYGV